MSEELKAIRAERDRAQLACQQIAERLSAAEARAEAAEARVVDVGASLAAAISLLERGGERGAPSRKMFDIMIADYKASLERARAALKSLAGKE